MAKDSIVIPATKKPTFWNRDAATGFFGGLLLPIPFANFAGLIIGGLLGKQRMEKDLVEGKKVDSPTSWNKTLIIGAGLASLIAVVAVPVILFPMVWTATEVVALPILALGLTAIVASPFVGAVIGSGMGKARMARDYNAALAEERMQSQAVPRAQNFGVTADEVARMESRFASADKTNFTDRINDQQAMQQQAAR